MGVPPEPQRGVFAGTVMGPVFNRQLIWPLNEFSGVEPGASRHWPVQIGLGSQL